MGNEMFQARLNDEFAEEIHEFREERHMNKSEAVRALLRAGLEAETEDDEPEAVADGGYTWTEWTEYNLLTWSRRLSIATVLAALASLLYAVAGSLGLGPKLLLARAAGFGLGAGLTFASIAIVLLVIEAAIIAARGLSLVELPERFREPNRVSRESDGTPP
jgi:Arc/MetJ-type ribon-helix-helix transcriptional regulator